MKNLGIVISVSTYQGKMTDLPGCALDGESIHELLKIEPRFDETILISENTSGRSTKSRLIEFLDHSKNDDIGDIVFYFTGHGEFYDDEFYYILSDFNPNRRRQTSLNNVEIDTLIRNLGPDLFVKIIDACQSGSNYIKDPSVLEKHLSKSMESFKNLYFMFSSQSNQKSYQDEKLSDFTRTVLESIESRESGTVRYRDIVEYVSDAFENNTVQTPHFISQASFTEPFCTVTNSIRSTLGGFLGQGQFDTGKQIAGTTSLTLVQKVRKDAEIYCSEEVAIESVRSLTQNVRKFAIIDDLQELYEFEFSEIADSPGVSGASIGEWLHQNREKEEYFAKVETEIRTRQRAVPKQASYPFLVGGVSALGLIGGHNLANDQFTFVDEDVSEIAGYKATIDLPYNHLLVAASPKLQNLRPAECYIMPVLSMTHLRFFWSFTFLKRVGWKELKAPSNLEWSTDRALIKESDEMDNLISGIISSFYRFIFEPIKSKWTSSEVEPNEGESGPSQTPNLDKNEVVSPSDVPNK